MAVRDAYPRPKLPTSHYFFSLARGENMRTFAVRPVLFWCVLSLGPILAAWSLGATLFIIFHDDMLGAIVAREADMQYAYEDRLADAHAQLDRVTSRQLLDQNSFEGKVHELLSRQAQLEQRTSIVASMAGQAGLGGETYASLAEHARLKQANVGPKAPATALMAIGAGRAQPAAADSVLDSVKAFAPVDSNERLAPGPGQAPPARGAAARAHQRAAGRTISAFADLNDAANNPDVAAPTRLSLISHSLDRMEKRQLATLGQIGSAASETIARLQRRDGRGRHRRRPAAAAPRRRAASADPSFPSRSTRMRPLSTKPCRASSATCSSKIVCAARSPSCRCAVR